MMYIGIGQSDGTCHCNGCGYGFVSGDGYNRGDGKNGHGSGYPMCYHYGYEFIDCSYDYNFHSNDLKKCNCDTVTKQSRKRRE